MTLKQIAVLGRKLVAFLALFADCFGRRESRELLRIYVQGQLSNPPSPKAGTTPWVSGGNGTAIGGRWIIAWVALRASAFLPDAGELLILCQDTPAVRRIEQPGGGAIDDRASPQRDRHMAIGRRPEARRASPTTRERSKQATLLPAAQPASREVAHENKNRQIHRDGN